MKFIPDTLAGRTMAIMLIGLGSFHLLSLWVYHVVGGEPHSATGLHNVVISTTAMAVGVVALSLLLVRTLTAPLRDLAKSAQQIGRAEGVDVDVRGPRELREVATAYNEMQHRINRLVEERTLALAAVSHDLKTPITRMRLRSEFIADPEIRLKMDQDLHEMEAMLDDTLAFLRGDSSGEEVRRVDLVALLETVCEDLADAGAPVTIAAPTAIIVEGRSLDLKRAFVNLIDNAIKHGGGAEVAITEDRGEVSVTIADHGPGIPLEKLEAVFAPFYRLDTSRSRDGGGTGLGLTVARAIVRAHGGEISLHRPAKGGLSVQVSLNNGHPTKGLQARRSASE